MSDPNTILTNKQKNLCEYGGTFGVLLTLTCLVQHLIFAIPGPITNPMIPAYVFTILAFIFLAFQKIFSVYLIVISAGLSLIIQFLWITHYAFSLVVMMLFIYHVVIVLVLFIDGIPAKLKMKQAAIKAEEDSWEGKI